jgi:hypothetical protein
VGCSTPRLATLIAAVILAAANLAPAGEPSTDGVQEMRSAIIAIGPIRFAAQVADDNGTLKRLTSGVATGRPQWLDIGMQLVGVAPPYVRVELVSAFSSALEANAEAVFERADRIPLDEVCGYDPLTPISSLPPCEVLDRLLAIRLRSIGAVTRADFRSVRDACVTSITRLKHDARGHSCTD